MSKKSKIGNNERFFSYYNFFDVFSFGCEWCYYTTILLLGVFKIGYLWALIDLLFDITLFLKYIQTFTNQKSNIQGQDG